MRLLTLAAAAALLLSGPAMAQNAGQIARVQAGAGCPKCNLFQADLGNRTLKGLNLTGARLRQANLSAGVYNRVSFAGGDLRDVEASASVFSSASFAGANLTNASFVGTYMQGANFRGAILTGTNFSGAEMDRAVGLTQGQLDRACGDEATTLPRGLRISACR